ncbi:MAG: Uma2 family endonuclease [Chloroflexi bacterium]|nr:Uma2 family endonuclease [Chloroflexota bacterium]
MATVQSLAEQRVLLHNVTWDTYEQLLAAHADSSSPHFTYDRGELEVMSPLPEHERLNRAIQLLVPLVANEIGVRVYSLGSTTFRREEIQRGFEPDSCFYVQNVERVRGKDTIDLRVDPPPDLVVEIDITSPSIPKLPIYVEFGVPEVWRYDARELQILLLEAGGYVEAEESRALPGVAAGALSTLLQDNRRLDDTEWMERVRVWGRTLGGRSTGYKGGKRVAAG